MTVPYPSPRTSPVSTSDFGTCGRAGRQKPGQPSLAAKPLDPSLTDMFGRPLDRRQNAIDQGVAARRRNWVDWPSLAIAPDMPAIDSFDWAAYAADFRAGTEVGVYIAVSDGLISTAKAARLSLAKIGMSKRADELSARFAEMNADRYGSLHMQNGRMIEDTGYDTYEPLRLPSATELARPSPVERLTRSLSVRLPASLAADVFDGALNAMLLPMLVSHWIETADGKRFAANQGIDSQFLLRFTGHILPDGSMRLKKAQEIFVFRRRQDTDKLVEGIERLIAKHLERSLVL